MTFMRLVRILMAAIAAMALSFGPAFGAKLADTGKEKPGKKESPRDVVVARWGNATVTAVQLKEFAINRAGMAMRHGNEITREGLRLILEELIGQRMLEIETLGGGILSDPAFANSYAIASRREVASRYIKEVLSKKFEVADDEVTPLLPKRRESVKIKHIVVQTPEEAADVLNRLREGMPFDEAIDRYSTVKSAAGAFVEVRDTDDYLDEEVRRKIFELPQGEMTGVLPLKIGYGIVMSVEKRIMDDAEMERLAQERRRDLFEKKVARHYETLKRDAGIELNARELMLAAGEDYEFMKPHRRVLTVAGEQIHFDDYVRTREVHLRDTLKVRSADDLYAAYKVEFENLGIALALARQAATEKGWTAPEGDRDGQLRKQIALRAFAEKLFVGISAPEEELKKEFEKNKKAFTIRKRLKIRQLTFKTRKEAEDFRKTVKTAEDFHRELRQRETKEDRYQNVFFEYQDFDRLDADLRKAFEKAKKGRVTDIVSSGDKSFRIFLVDDIETNYVIPYAEARMNIKRYVLRQKQEAKLAEFVAGQRKKTKVEIFDAPLETITADLNRKRKSMSPGHGGMPGGSQ